MPRGELREMPYRNLGGFHFCSEHDVLCILFAVWSWGRKRARGIIKRFEKYSEKSFCNGPGPGDVLQIKENMLQGLARICLIGK